MQTNVSLGDFLEVAGEDPRIRPVHICLYVALLDQWSRSGGLTSLPVRRETLMRTAHISARGTYHRALRELHEYGYIRYTPSFDPGGCSVVCFRAL